MKTNYKEIEKIVLIIIFIFAIFIRFLNLGTLPLSDLEAKIAVQSSQLLSGSDSYVNSDTLLTNLIAGLMYIFENSEWVVRFFSALAGALFIFTPLLFRSYFNKSTLLIISLWIAVDPGMLALSRQINSSLLVVFFGILFFFSYIKQKPIWMGIFGGVLLLCGVSFWFGFVPILCLLIYFSITKWRTKDLEFENKLFNDRNQIRKFFYSLVVSIIIFGTFSLFFPKQLSGMAQGFVDYLQGWKLNSGVSSWELIRAMLVYDFPVFIFGILGLIISKRILTKKERLIGVWLVLNFVHLLVYPSRQIDDSIWIIFPLILYGSLFMNHFGKLEESESKLVLLISGIGFIVLGFLTLISINLLSNSTVTNQSPISKTILIVAGIVLVLFAIFLIGWSLSWRIAGKSILYIVILHFGIYTLSAGWNAAGLRLPYENEMWYLGSKPVNEDLVVTTLEDYSDWNYGHKYEANIQVAGLNYPALKWALRNFENVEYIENISKSSRPDMIITKSDQTVELEESYKGQDFEWSAKPIWDLLISSEWTNWILSRRIPASMKEKDPIILWIRNDLFPGYISN
ncbi:MAG: hypothetical protein ACYDH1_07275 [Anaerolineaceae bacterium]